MTLTVFAGTFNPIHTGHLIIAESIRIELNTEKILFIPSFIPPQKNGNSLEAGHRLNMLKLATEDNPLFEVSDVEFKLEGTSYTYNTIQELYEQNPSLKKINFILGADAFNNLETWHKYEELIKMLNFIVMPRPKCTFLSDIKNNPFLNYRVVMTPEIEISSSYVRNRIKENKSIKYLVPDVVERYIKKNGLYCF